MGDNNCVQCCVVTSTIMITTINTITVYRLYCIGLRAFLDRYSSSYTFVIIDEGVVLHINLTTNIQS